MTGPKTKSHYARDTNILEDSHYVCTKKETGFKETEEICL